MSPDDIFQKWFESKDARAVAVRKDIIKGIYMCRNEHFTSDIEYLSSKEVLLDSIKRKGYKITMAEEFVE